MHDAGHQPSRPYVKCVRVTGDVMGKYHPHDSSSIYACIASASALLDPLNET